MQIFGNNNPKLIFAVRDNYSPISTEEGGCKIQRDRTTVSVRLEGDVKVGAKELCVQTFQMDLNLRRNCAGTSNFEFENVDHIFDSNPQLELANTHYMGNSLQKYFLTTKHHRPSHME